ncbi:MAG: hypothetical protein C0490_26185, partial [Marivirga sp.]|nr:hypothetical protein [Marivirga sp.]
MKTLALFVFLLSYVTMYGQNTINDVGKINETVNSFAKAFMYSQTTDRAIDSLPKNFILTVKEYKEWKQKNNPNIADAYLEKQYAEAHLPRISRNYKYVRQKLDDHLEEILSFDTVTFKIAQDPVVDVSIRYTTLNREKKKGKAHIAVVFLLYHGQLKFIGEIKQTTDYDRDQDILDRFLFRGEDIFITKYLKRAFTSSVYNGIPFEQNKKWGLMSSENTILLPAVYDSIFPFTFKYAKVVVNGRYNLIDTAFKRVFAQPVKKIITLPDFYAVTDQKGVKTFPGGDPMEYETVTQEKPKSQTKTPEELLRTKLKQDYESSAGKYKISNEEENGKGSTYFVIDNTTKDTLSIHRQFQFVTNYGLHLLGYRNDSTFIMDLN